MKDVRRAEISKCAICGKEDSGFDFTDSVQPERENPICDYCVRFHLRSILKQMKEKQL